MKNTRHTPKILFLLVLFALQVSHIKAQTASPNEPMMVNAKITSTGDLEITPSKTSSQNDFDFFNRKKSNLH